MIRVLSVIGTRPEAIKMAPVIQLLGRAPWCTSRVVATAQHRELLDQALSRFNVSVDVDLDIMTRGQTLAHLTARLLDRLDVVVNSEKPDLILAQGDTTTVLVAALVAFYRHIPLGHVEAGLRTGNVSYPFPEEFNRVVVSRAATMHFAPTVNARTALLGEGVASERIIVTGSTVVDALVATLASRPAPPLRIPQDRRLILLTAHRRENFGAPLARIFRAVVALVARYTDIEIVYPVHPNPEVRQAADGMLASTERVHCVEPLDYASFVALLDRALFVMTDSGGLQEEASVLGKPVLILREETERPEVVAAGVAKLVGADEARIIAAASALLTDPKEYSAMARRVSLYGDGHAAELIVEHIRSSLAPEDRSNVTRQVASRREGQEGLSDWTCSR